MNEKLIISEQNKERELDVFLKVKDCINERKLMVYNAGAGAGKTYDLTRSIRYIVREYGDELKYTNSKILCITYTNAATDELKNRLGNTELVDISTIHTRIWEIIKPYKKQLLEIHSDKLFSEINEELSFINDDKKNIRFRELDFDDMCDLIDLMCLKENKDIFYKYSSKGAVDFRNAMLANIPELKKDKVLSNVDIFKKWIKSYYKIERYFKTIERINSNIKNDKVDYTRVNYDARINSDGLSKMRISHDTLLEYANILISTDNYASNLIKRIIISEYPFILIDEYQDTNSNVINLLKKTYEYSLNTKQKIFMGFYGDHMQTIYESGASLEDFDDFEIEIVDKVFNRRSSSDIIAVANSIRGDGLIQESIYEEYNSEEPFFYTTTAESTVELISMIKRRWNINSENPLHCFELTNKEVAKQNGFENFYNFFIDTPYYKSHRYKQLNTEIMSQDIEKLYPIVRMIYNMLNFSSKLLNKNTPVSELIDFKDMVTLKDIISLKKILHIVDDKTFQDFIESYFQLLDKKEAYLLKSIFSPASYKSVTDLRELLYRELFVTGNDEISNSDSEFFYAKIDKFLLLDFTEFKSWYAYIENDMDGDTVHHTLHSSKGLEYDNVLIILDSKFGRKEEFFSDYFSVIGEPINSIANNKDLTSAHNLMYVGVTRAIKRLGIVYRNRLTTAQECKVSDVFGEVLTFESSKESEIE